MVDISVDQALDECRKSWGDFFNANGLQPSAIMFSDGSPIQAWCLHHAQLSEELSEPIENRIQYILREKPEHERSCRFLNLRPMSHDSIAVTGLASAEHKRVTDPAWAEYVRVTNPAWAEYVRVTDPAWAEYRHSKGATWAEYERVRGAAWAEYERVKDAASAEYKRVTGPACDEYERVMGAAHMADVPNHTWNGNSIFA